MAVLYPTPLPRSVIDDPMRAAERKVYEALGAGLDAAHRVFYGVAWLAKAPEGDARDGEADFIVAHPEKGVLLLEVKGGGVARDGTTGRWASTDRNGVRHDIQDPFAQVRGSKHALLHKLKDHPGVGAAWIELGHGVVFPDCARPRLPLCPDASPEITVFAGDLPRISWC